MKKTIEFYINRKFYKSCDSSKWDKTVNKIKSDFKKKGYIEIWDERFMNKIPNDTDIYINPLENKCFSLSTKIYSGLKDKEGNKIYLDDIVTTPFGFDSEVSQHYNNGCYYVRKTIKQWAWEDHDLKDFNECVKIKDCVDFPKESWNTQESITLNEI